MASAKVCVIDDDESIVDLPSSYLTQEGFQVDVARDGRRLGHGPGHPGRPVCAGDLTQDQHRQMQHELAPRSRWWGPNLNILIILILGTALVLVAAFGAFGMHGGWPGPGYPGRPGEWPTWMPHMWGR